MIPKVNLTTFVLSVSSAIYMNLSDEKLNLELARHNIDLLELLFEKTKGNRTSEEERILEQLLFETRIKFLEVQKK